MSEAMVTVAEVAAAMGPQARRGGGRGKGAQPDDPPRLDEPPALTVAEPRAWHPVRPDETSNTNGPGRSINATRKRGPRAASGHRRSRPGGAGEGRHPRAGVCLPGGPGCRRRGRCPVGKAQPTAGVRRRRLLRRPAVHRGGIRMIEYGAELAAGLRTRRRCSRSLRDHSGLTTAQLDPVAEAEGIPTAIRVRGLEGGTAQAWPAHGRGPPPPGRAITSPRRDRGFWRRQTHPVGGLGHVAADAGKAWSTSVHPFPRGDSTSAARTPSRHDTNVDRRRLAFIGAKRRPAARQWERGRHTAAPPWSPVRCQPSRRPTRPARRRTSAEAV